MNLNDFLTPNDLFHPKVFYDGEWILGGEFGSTNAQEDYLYLNAKVENGKNAYQMFLEENYYRPLNNILNSKSLSHTFPPKISLSVDEKEGNRVARFAMSVFIYQQILGLFQSEKSFEVFQNFISNTDTQEEWLVCLKQLLREDRKIFSDVKSNGMQSNHFGNVYQLYLDYVRSSKITMRFEEFLEGKISGTTKLIFAIKYYPELFEKEIPIEQLLEAFDYDTFCLVAAKSAMDSCKVTEERENLVDNAVSYVRLYLDAVDSLREEKPNYDCAIRIVSSDGKVKKIRIQDIRKEYESLLARHPEFSFIKLSDKEASTLLQREGMEAEQADSFDFSIKDNHATLEAILKKLKQSRELAAEWEFIPKGASESTNTMHNPLLHPNPSLSESEKIRRMLIGREYLENSDYAYKIYGINKFEGYVGYIYANGSVIFEKYYENINTKRVSASSATYVMGLDNFMEMSKLSKTEIIKLIQRDSGANVKRIFHREDMDRWKSDVARVISGSDYTEEVMQYIDTLISHNDLKKSGVKS